MDTWRAGDRCHCVLMSFSRPKAGAVRASKVPFRNQTAATLLAGTMGILPSFHKTPRLFQHKDDWAHTTTCTARLGKDISFCLAGYKGLINHLMICVQTLSRAIGTGAPVVAQPLAGLGVQSLATNKGWKRSNPPLFTCINIGTKEGIAANDISEQPGSIRTVTKSGN